MDDELVDMATAAVLLEVAHDRVQVMIDEGLLTPVQGSDGGGLLFSRAELMAVRELGG